MIYFDNSSTTKPYKEVIDSFVTVSTKYFGNPSSLHRLGAQAEGLLSQARKQVAKLLEVKEQEIYFTSGGTEGNNLAIKGVASAYQNRGKHIIVSAVEHASAMKACEQLKELGFKITVIPVDENGRVDALQLISAVTEDTILVTVMHVNNEVGSIQPIQEIGQALKAFPKVFFHVDAVQSVGKIPLSLKENRIDLCTISGHKFHGLKGTGVLYMREGIKLSALFSGGEQERKMRSGTENVAGAVCLAKALRISMEKSQNGVGQFAEMMTYIRTELEKIDEVVIHSPKAHCAPHILNFSVPKIKSEVFVHALEEKDVYVSTTSACSSKNKAISETVLLMTNSEELAVSSMRISLSYDNNMSEAKQFIKVFKEVLKNLKEVMK